MLSIGIWSNNLQRPAVSEWCFHSRMKIECTFGADHQTTALLGALVYRLDDVDQFLLVLEHPVQLVVVSRAKIAHHMLIAVEEHNSHPIVELVHLVEVWHLVKVA